MEHYPSVVQDPLWRLPLSTQCELAAARAEDGAQPRSLSDEAGLRANARDHLAKLRAD